MYNKCFFHTYATHSVFLSSLLNMCIITLNFYISYLVFSVCYIIVGLP